MRKLNLTLLASLFLSTSGAIASEAPKTCIFGENGSDLEVVAKANGLRPTKAMGAKNADQWSEMEKDMVIDSLIDSMKESGVDIDYDSNEAIIKDFKAADGFIQRIYGSFGKYIGFTVVVAFPGDAMVGYIYGLKRKSDGSIAFQSVARFNDGDIENCTVLK